MLLGMCLLALGCGDDDGVPPNACVVTYDDGTTFDLYCQEDTNPDECTKEDGDTLHLDATCEEVGYPVHCYGAFCDTDADEC